VKDMLSENLIRGIERNCRKSFSGLFEKNFDFHRMACEFVSQERAREELFRLQAVAQRPLAGKSLLEIGSGYGMLLAVARREFGVESFGLEPAEQFEGTFEMSRSLLLELGLPCGIVEKGLGECNPYSNEHFDLVYSSNVLEHVQDPGQVIGESLRVLRPGGLLVFVVPNYGSWWEGHYGMIMIPHSPKWLLKCEARLLSRETKFVDTLQLVTYRRMQQWLCPYRKTARILTMGQEIWEKRLRTLDFSEWASLGKLKKILAFSRRLGLNRLLARVGKTLHWETPFILVMEKLASS